MSVHLKILFILYYSGPVRYPQHSVGETSGIAEEEMPVWFPVTYIATVTVSGPGGRWQMQAPEGLMGLQTCYISSSNNYPFFNITMLLHIKRAVFVL